MPRSAVWRRHASVTTQSGGTDGAARGRHRTVRSASSGGPGHAGVGQEWLPMGAGARQLNVAEGVRRGPCVLRARNVSVDARGDMLRVLRPKKSRDEILYRRFDPALLPWQPREPGSPAPPVLALGLDWLAHPWP